MSALPQPSERAHAAAAELLYSVPRSATRWALTLGGGILAALVLQQYVDFRAPFSAERKDFSPFFTVLFAVAVWVVVKGVRGAFHWMRMRALAKQRPLEPWLWDYPWQRERVDFTPRLGALIGLAMLVGIGLFVGAINAFVVFAVVKGWPLPPIPFLIGCAFLGLFDVVFIRNGVPAFKRGVHELRHGQLRLRLPRIPLALGTQPQLELVLPRGLPDLRSVKIVLQRFHERRVTTRSGNKTTISWKRLLEYTHTQKLDVRDLESVDGFSFVLDLPQADPAASTALNGNPARVWEIEITCDAPKVEMTPITFQLPVYVVDESIPLEG